MKGEYDGKGKESEEKGKRREEKRKKTIKKYISGNTLQLAYDFEKSKKE